MIIRILSQNFRYFVGPDSSVLTTNSFTSLFIGANLLEVIFSPARGSGRQTISEVVFDWYFRGILPASKHGKAT
jgi:hypothetical protein